jgi:hypothetical protein
MRGQITQMVLITSQRNASDSHQLELELVFDLTHTQSSETSNGGRTNLIRLSPMMRCHWALPEDTEYAH